MNPCLPFAARALRLAALSGFATLAVSTQALAGYGVYLNGSGIQSSGVGGIAYSLVQDSYVIAANPALVAAMPPRVDFGLEWDEVDPSVYIRGNANGPDQTYKSRKTHFPIPQAGVSFALSDRWSAGFTGFVAGTGADYPKSPLERFGGPSAVTLELAQGGVTSALAFTPVPNQHLGFSLNVAYQGLSAEGAQAFTGLSESPDKVTNQGIDDLVGASFSLGYYGQLAPQVRAGLSYRSKTWTQRSKDYAGLLPDQGSFELPASYGAGLALTPTADLTLAVEYQRVLYAQEAALGNRIEQLTEFNQLTGSDEGPGFGWRNQNIYRLGVVYRASPKWVLRAGYSHASQQIPESQTFFSILSPSVNSQHYTLGASLRLNPAWEVTGFFAKALRDSVRGENSIPAFAGGGEVDLDVRAYSGGISFSRGFGK